MTLKVSYYRSIYDSLMVSTMKVSMGQEAYPSKVYLLYSLNHNS